MVATRREVQLPAHVDAPRHAALVEAPPRAVADAGVDAHAFRHAFRHLAATVAVTTLIGRDGRPHGMTVTSMCGLSVDPPTLLVCVDRSTRTHGDLLASERFGVDILAEHQHEIAAYCARRGTAKILPARWLVGPVTATSPHLAGTVARFDCRVETVHTASTHDIVVGRVERIDLDPEPASPLVYHDGAFVRLDRDRIPLAVADLAALLDED